MLPSPEKIQIILPIISCIFLVFSLKRSIYGVISYFIILNAKLGDMYPVLGAIRFELLAAVVVLASVFFQNRGVSKIFPSGNELNKPLWIYFSLAMASVVFSVDFTTSWDNGGYTLLKLMLFYIMVVASINTPKDLSKMVWAMIMITGWIAYEPFYNYLTGSVAEYAYGEVAYGRFGAATGHVALANTLSQGIPLAYYWSISQKNQTGKLLGYALLIFLTVGVIITKSRGGFLALVTIAAGISYLSKNRRKAFIRFGLCFIILLPLAGAQYLSRIETITGGISQSRSTSDRYMGLVHGISMMIKRPILGVGIGCYAEARRRFFHYYFFSHNLYGELFGELGLASISWFMWIYMLFKKSKEVKLKLQGNETSNDTADTFSNLVSAVQVGLATRLVIGNFSHCQMIWFWFLMAGMMVSIHNISRENGMLDENQNGAPSQSLSASTT